MVASQDKKSNENLDVTFDGPLGVGVLDLPKQKEATL